jgi:hypothetical protein
MALQPDRVDPVVAEEPQAFFLLVPRIWHIDGVGTLALWWHSAEASFVLCCIEEQVRLLKSASSKEGQVNRLVGNNLFFDACIDVSGFGHVILQSCPLAFAMREGVHELLWFELWSRPLPEQLQKKGLLSKGPSGPYKGPLRGHLAKALKEPLRAL